MLWYQIYIFGQKKKKNTRYISVSLPQLKLASSVKTLSPKTFKLNKDKSKEVKEEEEDVVAIVCRWPLDVRNRRKPSVCRRHYRPRRQRLGPELQFPSGFLLPSSFFPLWFFINLCPFFCCKKVDALSREIWFLWLNSLCMIY